VTPIRDAATLILLDRSEGPTKVLMGKRHAGHRFMPGKFVFPGGAVDPADRRMAVAGPLDARVSEKLLVRTRARSAEYARALALAAIRETFEETGLALGVTDLGAVPEPPAGPWAAFAATGVFPTLEGFDFLARAITPPARPKRFDARFFVADARWIAHRGEGVIHDEAELTELVWVDLPEALDLDIPNITRTILGDLAALGAGPWDLARTRPFYHAVRGEHRREMI
jgi:8-oxo-dGTP pyrophosphatase MutT (NUDIX family)